MKLQQEEIGLHVGDGSMNFYRSKNKTKGLYQLRGHSIDDKLNYYTRIKFLYKYLYNLDISLRHMPSTGVIGFQVWSDALVQFKHKVLGLCLGKKNRYNYSKRNFRWWRIKQIIYKRILWYRWMFICPKTIWKILSKSWD